MDEDYKALEERMRQLEEENRRLKVENARQTSKVSTQAELAGKPTEEQACAYMHYCLNMPEDVAKEETRKFIEYYDKLGWMIKGKAIKRWDNCVLGWVRKYKGFKGESIYEQRQADYLPSMEDGPAPF